MFRSAIGLAAISALSAPALAEEDRPCQELAIEMLAGDWDTDNFLIAGGEPYHFHTVSKGEIIGPGRVKFEAGPNVFVIRTYRDSGGTVEQVDAQGDALTSPEEIAIPACGRVPDTETYYWIEEGRTGPGGEFEYRKEFYASPKLAIEILQLKSPVQGNTNEYVIANSVHMTRRTSETD